MRRKAIVVFSLLACMAICAAACAYLISITSVDVGVEEAISVDPSKIEVTLYPNEEKTVSFTVSNAGSSAIDVQFSHTISGPTPGELTVSFNPKNSVTVAASGSSDVEITIKASSSIAVGTYTIEVSWER